MLMASSAATMHQLAMRITFMHLSLVSVFLIDCRLLRSRAEQLANVLGNLVVRHLVNRFHAGNLSPELLALDALLQLAFGFARPENPDRVRVLQAGNDLVVVFVEVAFGLALQLVFRHEIIAACRNVFARAPLGG